MERDTQIDSRDWVNKLKLAIINEDDSELSVLIGIDVEFDVLEEMQEASALLKEAIKLLRYKQSLIADELLKLQEQKKHLQYMRDTKHLIDIV